MTRVGYLSNELPYNAALDKFKSNETATTHTKKDGVPRIKYPSLKQLIGSMGNED